MPFQKGNQCAKNRTTRKNLLPIIREKVLRSLNSRISELSTVDVKELLAFARTIMPKDISITSAPSITFITSCPRPNSIDTTLVNDQLTDNTPNNSQTTMAITTQQVSTSIATDIATDTTDSIGNDDTTGSDKGSEEL